MMLNLYLVYYILKKHGECQSCIFELIQTTMNQSFILEAREEKKQIIFILLLSLIWVFFLFYFEMKA